MPEAWSQIEVEALVTDYFAMLEDELRERPYSKSAHRTALAPLLRNRSAPSIEFKHANVSAVLIDSGFPFISGYKPRSNYQALLRTVVEDRLRASPGLVQLAAEDVEAVPMPSFDDILSALVSPPKSKTVSERPSTGQYALRALTPAINYLAREANNRSLGLAGEEFVLAFERARLTAEGTEALASKVEHVAQTRGDGLGFDILSFDSAGPERLIEVKTTKYGADTPFFVSRNELAVSESMAPQYHLYRVFEFRRKGRLFALGGSLRANCSLEPESYIARVA